MPPPRQPAPRTGADPRQIAAGIVADVTANGRMLSDAAPAGSEAATRARALRLATTTLRNLQRADAVLAPLLRKPPPAPVLALLRVAVVELLDLGAAAHGVVNSAVTRARRNPGTAPFAGMINAVLRRVSETSPDDWAALPVPRLPGWLRRRLVAAYGPGAVAAIEAAHLAGAPLDLTVRPMPDAARNALLQALSEAADGAVELPGGSVRLPPGAQVSALPGFAEGLWWVQDAAAALPARLLGVQTGETVLDLCAAPGGKTMQLAAAGARVTAVDISAPRLERLRDNLARTNLQAEVVCADALHWQPSAPFDAVLLDAPCSATGTIRRHPDLPLIRKPDDIAPLLALQARLLDRALGLVRPGGRLVYCTCSLLPEEGEAQVLAACQRHTGWRIRPVASPPFGERTADGALRTRPDHLADQGGTDGFFIAMLERD